MINGEYLITIDSDIIESLRYSTKDTLGANEWWVPGMQTSGGQFEAVISRIEGIVDNSSIIIREILK